MLQHKSLYLCGDVIIEIDNDLKALCMLVNQNISACHANNPYLAADSNFHLQPVAVWCIEKNKKIKWCDCWITKYWKSYTGENENILLICNSYKPTCAYKSAKRLVTVLQKMACMYCSSVLPQFQV